MSLDSTQRRILLCMGIYILGGALLSILGIVLLGRAHSVLALPVIAGFGGSTSSIAITYIKMRKFLGMFIVIVLLTACGILGWLLVYLVGVVL